MARFCIGQREIGQGCPALIIAEVGQAHDGSLNLAHSFIDAVAECGADAVKFQTHIAAAESSPSEGWRVQFSRQDSSRYDYWKRMEFTRRQWQELKEHAERRELLFLSSPFSTAAVELLLDIGIQAWKVPSGEVRNELLLQRLLVSRLPLLVSCGMSSSEDLEVTTQQIRAAGVPHLLFQCTTAYPCPPERIGLNLLGDFRDRFRCETGLSDHSGTIWPSLAATVLGAKAVEVHVTWDRGMFGPDAEASVTFAELKQLVTGVRFIERMLAHPVDKGKEAAALEPLRAMFGQSLVAASNLPAGTILQAKDLTSRKPQIGIPTSEYLRLLGSKVTRAIKQGEFLRDEDIEA